MKRAIASEFLKLRSTRMVYLLLLGTVGLSVVTVLDVGGSDAFQKPFDEQTFVFFTSLLTRVLIFVLGVRLITDEFRHGTIIPTLLVTPRRGRVLGAKVVVAALLGGIAAALAWTAMTGVFLFIASVEGASVVLGAAALQTFIGMVVAGSAWAVIGVSVGAIVRNQLAATIGGIVWLMGVEDIVRSLLGDLGGYLPGQAGLGLVLMPDGVTGATMIATLTAYVVGGVVVATRSMRRDIA